MAIHGLRRTSHSARSTTAAAGSTSGKASVSATNAPASIATPFARRCSRAARGPPSENSGPRLTRLTRMVTRLFALPQSCAASPADRETKAGLSNQPPPSHRGFRATTTSARADGLGLGRAAPPASWSRQVAPAPLRAGAVCARSSRAVRFYASWITSFAVEPKVPTATVSSQPRQLPQRQRKLGLARLARGRPDHGRSTPRSAPTAVVVARRNADEVDAPRRCVIVAVDDMSWMRQLSLRPGVIDRRSGLMRRLAAEEVFRGVRSVDAARCRGSG